MSRRNKPGSWIRFKTYYISMRKKTTGLVCDYCGVELVEGEHPPVKNSLTIDHKLPLSKGGRLKDQDNLALACCECNSLKGSACIEEYI